MERVWERAQRISWKCHSHSAQAIDFGVVFKAAQLLLLPNTLLWTQTNLFNCVVPSEGEAIRGEGVVTEGGVVGYNTLTANTPQHPPNTPPHFNLFLLTPAQTRRTVTPLGIAGSLLKQTTLLWAVSGSVSGSDEDGARLFFPFRDVMGFYSCPCREHRPSQRKREVRQETEAVAAKKGG